MASQRRWYLLPLIPIGDTPSFVVLLASLIVLISPIASAQSNEVHVPFTMASDGRIWADVSIDGHTTHALIDTGANIPLVQRSIRLGVLQTERVTLGDGHAGFMLKGGVKICIGGYCVVMNAVESPNAYSVIPVTVLHHWTRITFDFKDKVLILSDGGKQ